MADDRRTEIGPDTRVTGDIEAREDVAVFGRVEGSVTSTHAVIVEEGGTVEARVHASRIVIAGALIGQAEATERIEITPTGRVLGTLVTPRLILEDGGAVQGDVVMDGTPAPVPQPVATGARPAAQRTATTATSATRRTVTTTTGATARTGREPAREAARPVGTQRGTTAPRAQAPARPAARPQAAAPAPEPHVADVDSDAD
jgi:cytoskeletal protein CcmA (bactofilin family)